MKKNIILGIFIFIGFALAKEPVTEEIVAYVNNEVILKSELEEAMSFLKKYGKDVETDGIRKEILEQLIRNKLILQEAKNKGLEVKEEEIETKLEEVKKESSKEEFEEILKNQNTTIEEVKKLIKENLLMVKLLQKEKETFSKIIVENKETEEFYQKNLAKFKGQDKVTLRQLVILFSPTKEDELRAKKEIEAIREKINQGESFEKLVKEYSQDEISKLKDGEFGIFKKGELAKEIEEQIFNLKPGEVTLPIKTEYGYHTFKLEEKNLDSVKIKHILIKITAGETAKQLAKEKTNKILEKVKQGTNFIELIKKYSDDPLAKKSGGEAVEITVEELALSSPVLKEKIEQMKVGEISEVMETEIGLSIFKLENFKEGVVIPLNDEVKEVIKKELIEQKWIEQLKEKATIEIKL